MTPRPPYAAALLFTALVLFFVDFDSNYRWRLLKPLFDPAHALYFGAVAIALVHWQPALRTLSFWRQLIAITLIAGSAGAFIELAQAPTSRSASLADIGRDLLGALAALVCFSPRRADIGRLPRQTLTIFAVAALLLVCYPAARDLLDAAIAAARFPVLADFSTPFEADRWNRGVVVPSPAGDTSSALCVQLTTERYSGATMDRLNGDWRGYRLLHLRLYNEGPAPLPVTLKVFDLRHAASQGDYHDRYNRVYQLAAGWNTVEVPLAEIERAPRRRAMDLRRIAELSIFTVDLDAPRRLCIDDVRLTR